MRSFSTSRFTRGTVAKATHKTGCTAFSPAPRMRIGSARATAVPLLGHATEGRVRAWPAGARHSLPRRRLLPPPATHRCAKAVARAFGAPLTAPFGPVYSGRVNVPGQPVEKPGLRGHFTGMGA
ncbi:hypothetical protein GCM10010106_33980 [Thermopolyspora flexuosa]|nr:hypothetical protein GCM10010106_33980 [Thermopolyspora flexuosa]